MATQQEIELERERRRRKLLAGQGSGVALDTSRTAPADISGGAYSGAAQESTMRGREQGAQYLAERAALPPTGGGTTGIDPIALRDLAMQRRRLMEARKLRDENPDYLRRKELVSGPLGEGEAYLPTFSATNRAIAAQRASGEQVGPIQEFGRRLGASGLDVMRLSGAGLAMGSEMLGRAVQGEPVDETEALASLAARPGASDVSGVGSMVRSPWLLPSVAGGFLASTPFRAVLGQLATKSPKVAALLQAGGENLAASEVFAVGEELDRAVQAGEIPQDAVDRAFATSLLGTAMGTSLAGFMGILGKIGGSLQAPVVDPMRRAQQMAQAGKMLPGEVPPTIPMPSGAAQEFPMMPSQRAMSRGMPAEAGAISQIEQAVERVPGFPEARAGVAREQAGALENVYGQAGRGEYRPTDALSAKSQGETAAREMTGAEESARSQLGKAYRKSEEQVLGEPLVKPEDMAARQSFMDALPGTQTERESLDRLIRSYGGDVDIYKKIKATKVGVRREAPVPGALMQGGVEATPVQTLPTTGRGVSREAGAQRGAPENYLQISAEATPGESIPFLPGIHEADYATRQSYHDAVMKTITNPRTKKNVVLEAYGVPEDAFFDAPGSWKEKTNPVRQYIVNIAGKSPEEIAALKVRVGAASGAMAKMLRQEAVAFHVPIFKPSTEINNFGAQNGIQVDIGRTLTPAENQALYSEIIRLTGNADLAPAAWSGGVRVMNFDDGFSNAAMQQKVEKAVQNVIKDGAHIKYFTGEGDLVNAEGKGFGGDYGKDFEQINSATERPTLQSGVLDPYDARVTQVADAFSRKYQWGKRTGAPRPPGVAVRPDWEQQRKIINPVDPNAAPTVQAQGVLRLAEREQKNLDAALKRVDDALHTRSHSRVKLFNRIFEKTKRKTVLETDRPGYGPAHMRDVLAFEIVAKDLDQIPEAVSAFMDESGAKLIKGDADRLIEPELWGYRGTHFDFQLPSGLLVEARIPIPEMSGPILSLNHKLYEKWRRIDPEKIKGNSKAMRAYDQDIAQSNARYDLAWDQALKRLGLDETALKASVKRLSARLPRTEVKSLEASGSTMPTSQGPSPTLATEKKPPSGVSPATTTRPTPLSSATMPGKGEFPQPEPGAETVIGEPPSTSIIPPSKEKVKPEDDDLWRSYPQRGEVAGKPGIKGAYLPGKREARFYKGADISTAIHEFIGHDLETTAITAPERLRMAKDLQSAGVKVLKGADGKWSTEAREKFAEWAESLARAGLKPQAGRPMRPSALAGGTAETIKKGMEEVYPNVADLPDVPAGAREIIGAKLERSRVVADIELPQYRDLESGTHRITLQDEIEDALTKKFGIEPGRDVGTVGKSAIDLARSVADEVGKRRTIGEIRSFIKTDLNPRLNPMSGKIEMLGKEFSVEDKQAATILREIKRVTHDHVRGLWRKNLTADLADKLDAVDKEMLESYAAGTQGLNAITDVIKGKAVEPDKFYSTMNKLSDVEIRERFDLLAEAEKKAPVTRGFANEVRDSYREGFLFSILEKNAGAGYGIVPSPAKLIRFWSDMPGTMKDEAFTFVERKMLDRTAELLRKAGFGDPRMVNPSQTAYTLAHMEGGSSVVRAFRDLWAHPIESAGNAIIRRIMKPERAAKEFYRTGSTGGIDRALAFMDAVNRFAKGTGKTIKETGRLGAQEVARPSQQEQE